MPNWVYNTILVNGKPEDVQAFVEKATTPYKTYFTPWNKDVPTEETVEGFSFWNFIRPDEDKLDLYFETNGLRPDPENPGKFIKTGDSADNWYSWNSANWGCKWDAIRSDVDYDNSKPQAVINFETPWCPPEAAFVAMADQHPELIFSFEWEEEQGWGGQANASDGFYEIDFEWDAPSSHSEWADIGKLDRCLCAENVDKNDWYDDCPREDN